MRCTGSIKPSSAMWSASSITVMAIWPSEVPALRKVFDASGGADCDIDAALQCVQLRLERLATDELPGEKPDRASDRLHRAVDLQRASSRVGAGSAPSAHARVLHRRTERSPRFSCSFGFSFRKRPRRSASSCARRVLHRTRSSCPTLCVHGRAGGAPQAHQEWSPPG